MAVETYDEPFPTSYVLVGEEFDGLARFVLDQASFCE